MVDSCHLNPLECKHNGTCVTNIPSNTTYCQCGPCYTGTLCQFESVTKLEDYTYFIIYIIQFCFSFINNGLVLELLIRCSRIRNSNCGIYLLIYSILSFVLSILLLVHQVVKYYMDQPSPYPDQYLVFRCYTDKVGNALVIGRVSGYGSDGSII